MVPSSSSPSSPSSDAPPASALSVQRVTPSVLQAGESYDLVILGAGLDLRTVFDFGEGVEAIGAPVLAPAAMGPVTLRVHVRVSEGAPAGVRVVGARAGSREARGPARITVRAAPPTGIAAPPRPGRMPSPPSSAPPPVVAPSPPPLAGGASPPPGFPVGSVIPSQWKAGSSYDVVVSGVAVTASTELRFGAGVSVVGKPKVLGSSKVSVHVQIAKDAKPGPRALETRPGPSGAWQEAAASAYVVPGVTIGVTPVPAWSGLETVFAMGTIYLAAPRWGTYGQSTEVTTDYGLPLLNDELKFEWSEQNPGTAQHYELRILDAKGKVLHSWKGTQRWYRPSAQTVVDLLGPAQVYSASAGGVAELGTMELGKIGQVSDAALGTGGNAAATKKDPNQVLRDSADLFWEVSGYRAFPKSGVPAGSKETVTLEVEKSERWPLARPMRPNGFGACQASGKQWGISITNVDGGKGGTKAKAVNHPGDRFVLQGKIDLSKSPYAVHSKANVNAKQPGQIVSTVQSFAYENLFVDWGDGDVRPLTLPPQGSVFGTTSHGDAAGDEKAQFPGPLAAGAVKKSYAYPGTYTAKVYQLPSKDIQQTPPQILSHVYENLPASPHLGGPVGDAYAGASGGKGGKAKKLAKPGGGAAGGGVASATLPGGAGESLHAVAGEFDAKKVQGIADEAVVLFCHAVVIDPYKDEVAFGPLHLEDVEVEGFGGDDAKTSTCNQAFQASAKLEYYGEGDVEVTWAVGDVVLATEKLHVGPSTPREGDPKSWGAPKTSTFDLVSPMLPTDAVGKHLLRVEVNVVASFDFGLLLATVVENVSGKDVRQAPKTSAGGRPPKVGLLSSLREGSGKTPIVFAKEKPKVAGDPPKTRVVARAPYEVGESDPSSPCHFVFPTQEGDFDVYLEQETLKGDAGGWSGNGTLRFLLANGPSGAKELAAPIGFSGWASPDGLRVSAGAKLEASPGSPVSAPAFTGTVKKLAGVAESTMEATLDLELQQKGLRDPGTTNGKSWAGQVSTLSAAGDWIRTGVKLSDTSVYWSGFRVSSSDTVLDLSRTKGPGGACGPADGTFLGLHLGSAKVVPNTLDLVSVTVAASDWVVTEHLCGMLQVKNPVVNQVVGKGSISIHQIDATFANGSTDATYDMSVGVPFLDTTLTGKATLVETKTSEGELDFAGLGGSGISRTMGPITMKASDFRFGKDQGGWRVIANTWWDFQAEGKALNAKSIAVPDIHFGLTGTVWFDDSGAKTLEQPVTGKGTLVKTPLDLVSLRLEGPQSGDEKLDLSLRTQAKLSKAMPAVDVQVKYGIVGDGYNGWGPQHAPFQVSVPFPAGQPTTNAEVFPEYAPKGNDLFAGKVDLAMFGGPPITGEFRLGYSGSSDYWLTRVTVPLGSGGVSLAPIPLNLYRVRGGLGYHMAISSFQDTGSLAGAKVDLSTELLFMAGMRVGTPDQFALMADGDFTVATGANGGARMDFHAWLLTKNHGGSAPLQGFLQYQAGNFDLRAWGHFSFLQGIYSVDLGSGENDAAIDAHFGGGDWHVYAGKKDGPRIQASFFEKASVDSYLMLGNAGLNLGGGEHFYLGVGGNYAKAYVKGWMDVGVGITPAPKISGDFNAGVKAGACAFDVCANVGATAKVHAEALPLQMKANAKIGLPWPAPDIHIKVRLK